MGDKCDIYPFAIDVVDLNISRQKYILALSGLYRNSIP